LVAGDEGMQGVCSMKHMLDLYSGLGGMSEAFVQSPNWTVLRIDNNMLLKDVPKTVIMDIRHLNPSIGKNFPRIDYIHASPPCTDFSVAYSSPRGKHQRERPKEEYLPDMTWLIEALRIIKTMKPKYWSIENVRGASKYFTPLLGEPSLIIGSFMFWGNHPIFAVKDNHTKYAVDVHSANPLRANIRARIPMSISKGMMTAIESQRSIFDY